MAVETRFVVVRGGNEIMTFADKKAADEYDRMLDMADNISVLLEKSEVELTDKSREDLCVYLAKNREEMLIALLAKKRPASAEVAEKPAEKAAKQPAEKKKKAAKKEA
jgi:dsDNA-binding SOS-regulon protein